MLRHGPQPCCPPPAHPQPLRIQAGLQSLPRQATAFPHYRRAMLQAIGVAPPLRGWTADSAHDLGVMLIEAWAYVLDVLGFYDVMVAERSYLGTARDDAVAAQIVALTGYRPRPAMVSRVRLALEARGRDAVLVPAGTGFRSQPFGAEKAQVFELAEAGTAWPQRNRWELAPHRLANFDGVLRFAPGQGPVAGAIVSVVSGSLAHAARVVASEVGAEADGERYRRVTLDPPLPAAFTGVTLASLDVATLALAAFPSPLDGRYAWSSTSVILDALYPMLQSGQPAAIEIDGVLHAVKLGAISIHPHSQSVGSGGATATIPLTTIGFPALGTLAGAAAVRCHLLPKPAGPVLRPTQARVSVAMIREQGRLAESAPELDEAPSSGAAFALGGRPRGLDLPGTLQVSPVARYVPDAVAADEATLEAPVSIFGNVLVAIRGETVVGEVLGSGNGQVPGQRFTLKKKPLSWIEDAGAPSGRSPRLAVRVDGVAWRHVESFFGRGPEERVFVVDMASDGGATIACGDGERGARFPSGVKNIVATYCFGAGAAKPPPGSIHQFARAAAGLSRVLQPLDAWGGADAETAAEIRELAPAASLTLGRAVSLADFQAMIRSHSGILNASVAYSWDVGRQAAVVTGWIIADAGDPSGALAAYLAARALPGLAIRIQLAEKVVLPLFDVAIVPAPEHAAQTVSAAVRRALFDPDQGLLSPRHVPVGAPLFRSVLLAALHEVPGVAQVASITLASGPMPKAITPGEGRWFDFLSAGQVL